jgi:hypothetical protein
LCCEIFATTGLNTELILRCLSSLKEQMRMSRRKILLAGAITAGSAGALYLFTSEAWGDVAFGRILADLGYYGMVHLTGLPRRLVAPHKRVEPLPPSNITAAAKISGETHPCVSIHVRLIKCVSVQLQ